MTDTFPYHVVTCSFFLSRITKLVFLHGCTVHVDSIKSFICPTNAHINYFKCVKLLKHFKITTLAPTVSVYINHHQGARSLCFAKVTILISVIHVLDEVVGTVAAYFVQSRCVCILHCAECSFCTVQDRHTAGLNKIWSHSTDNSINDMYN